MRRRKQGIWSILFIIATIGLSSCNKDEFESGKDTVTSFATVYIQGEQPDSFILVPDGGGATMYITKTSVNKKELTLQQRVVATYTLLKNITPQNLADHSLWNVRLDNIMDLTCKSPVLKSQIENSDELGTGVLSIKNIHFTGRYLNIEYEHVGKNHDINLWFDDTNYPASNTWIASLCLNSSATEANKIKEYVSFDLGTLVRETIENRYAPNADDPRSTKLILCYYESAGKQVETHYTIYYSTHWIGLIEKNKKNRLYR